MAKNDFKPFSISGGANVISQAEYEGLPYLSTGFSSGVAKSNEINKVLRQASFIASALAQFVSDKANVDVLDDGSISGFNTKLGNALNKVSQPLDTTLSALAQLVGTKDTLPYFTGTEAAALTDLTQVGRDIIGKSDISGVIQYLGLKDTLNPSKRVSIGPLGSGLFDGSKPSINIGDSDSGFIFESDGVIGIYANNQKIAELTNTGIKSIGYMTILSGALILDNDTYFLRHSSADNAGFSGNNIELGSWNGIGFPCTYDQITRIYLNTRTGEIGLTGDLKAGGNVYSGSNAWLDQTGNLQGSAWGEGVGLKQYIANQIATQKSYIDNGFNKKNTASLAVNGWYKDESTGIITQWGAGNTTTNGANVTYPIPFPNACTSIAANERNNNITPVIINFSGVGKTGFTVQAWNNNAARVDSLISWFATGY
ncbi:tail fiber protein [Citrobacter freundii]